MSVEYYNLGASFFLGIVIPFLTNWIQRFEIPEYIETLMNAALSAIAAALSTIVFDGNWSVYWLAFGTAWVGSLRMHYTGIPQMVYKTDSNGRHAKQDQS